LDPNSYVRFTKLLRDHAARGCTICIIEHNLDIVTEVSDKIAFLDRGKLLANGPAKDVLSNPDLAALYFGDRAQ
jgi:ABC-type branched-subunit amino acid transport system ATPase component